MVQMSGMIKGAAVLGAGLWLVGAAASLAHAQDAKALYDKNCASCHGTSGKGDGPAAKILKPPPPDMSAKSASEADVIKIVKEGGKGVGRSAAMPAYGAKLSDDQIKALAELVKGFSSK